MVARWPLEHAHSLWRQHRNFTAMHRSDPFVRRYMADLGHFEFGALHRPIAFPGLAELTGGLQPTSLDYWLGYWIAAFDHVLACLHDDVHILSYEAVCADPRAGLERVCTRLDIAADAALEGAAGLFKPAPPPRADATACDSRLHDRARTLHDALVASQR